MKKSFEIENPLLCSVSSLCANKRKVLLRVTDCSRHGEDRGEDGAVAPESGKIWPQAGRRGGVRAGDNGTHRTGLVAAGRTD